MRVVSLTVGDQKKDVVIKEFSGVRVVTFREVDMLHERPAGAARKTFNSHRNQFVEGEDYFVLNTDEAYNFFGLKAPNGLILLTESGYLLLVKPFTDDLAWKVQRQLVTNYFKAKEMVQQHQPPQSIEDILISALTSMKEMKSQLNELREDNQKLRLVVDNEVVLTKAQRAEIQQAVDRRQGELNIEGYTSAHFQGIYKSLKTHFNVPSYSDIKRSDFENALKLIAGWYPKKKENSPS